LTLLVAVIVFPVALVISAAVTYVHGFFSVVVVVDAAGGAVVEDPDPVWVVTVVDAFETAFGDELPHPATSAESTASATALRP
jgi:hypothetical protein